METDEMLSVVFEKQMNHKNILKINEHHGDFLRFDFKHGSTSYVENILKGVNINKATGYDQLPLKMVKMCSKEL